MAQDRRTMDDNLDDLDEPWAEDLGYAPFGMTPRDEARVSARGRAARRAAAREAQAAKRRRVLTYVGIAAAILLCFVLLRSAVGAVGRLFRGGDDTNKQQTVATKTKDKDTSEEQEEPAAEPVTIELAMVGDILQHAGVYSSGFRDDGSRNYDHIFQHVASELEGADIKVVNQETVLGGEVAPFSGYPSFNGPQEMGDAEAKVGFNVVLRATNHALDVGYAGLVSELDFWRTKHPEVAVIGAINPDEEGASFDDVMVYEKDGFTVALLNYTYDLNGYEDPKGAVSMLTEENVRSTVEKADAMADMVVVFPHWGEEYNLLPVDDQEAMAQIFMDCGADVIIGGHPHVIEPVEVLTASDGRRVPCFWSVGNFVSTQVTNEMLVGGVAHVTLEKDADGTCQVTRCSFVPTVTKKGVGTDMSVYLLRDYTDEMAATNYLESNGTDNRDLTRAWAEQFCQEVLGERYSTSDEMIVFGEEEFEPVKQEDKDTKAEKDESSEKKAA